MGVIPSDASPDEGVGATFGRMEGPTVRTGFFENAGAGYKAAQAGPGSTRSRQAAFEARYYDQIVAALAAEGEQGEDYVSVRPGGIGYRGPQNVPVNRFGVGQVPVKRAFRNPYTSSRPVSQGDNPLQRLYLGGDRTEMGAIWQAVARVRARKPDFLKDFPDETTLRTKATMERERQLARAEAVTSKAGVAGQIGSFVGGLAGSLVAGDPENFVGMGASASAGKTVARTIIKRGVQEGALNAAAGAVALPGIKQDTERLGGEMTARDAVTSVAEQFALGTIAGSAFEATPHVLEHSGKVVKRAGNVLLDRVAENASGPVRDALAAASLRAGTVKDRELLREYRKAHSPYAIGDTATPDEKAAAHVIERDIETREASPFHGPADTPHETRLEAIADSLGVELATPALPSPAPIQTPTVRDRTETRRPASYEQALHGAEGTGKNPDSSASGHFQFTEGTWLEYAPKVTNTAGMGRAQILGLRHDRGIAERAERAFRADNARYLLSHGVEDSPGNLSLAHFLGRRDAARVLKAAPDTPVVGLVDAASIRANRNVFKNIHTADDLIAWGHKRIGAAVDSHPARPDAVPHFDPLDPVDYAEVRPYGVELLRPDEIETDAAIMQYKSGGDESGVLDTLKGVEAWNPILAQQVLVWQGLDNRRIVVDGHQRTGLAKRLFPDDPTIRLPAVIVREEDGITPRMARVLGALRNITNGTGTLLDNARVLRDAPNGARMLPPNVAHAKESLGLSRLSHEAFGAVVNDVIDPRVASQIGLHAAPETHMSMVDLLTRERIHNPREAAAIVRQAQADGFGTVNEEQLSLLGDVPVQSLYVPIARIMEAAAKRLRNEKRVFRTLRQEAGRIEAAGNVLDQAANEGRVIGSDEALAILNATAYSSGPVRDALIAAARAELSGTRRGDAVSQFLDAIGGIDLRSAARGVEPDGGPRGASERDGLEIATEEPDAELPDSDEPSLFDTAVAVRERAEAFSDPVGPEAKQQTDILEHDLLMDAGDRAIAERQRQEAQLRTDSPMRPGDIDPDGTMGLGLFDAADQPTFRLSDEGDARPIQDIMGEAEADEMAAKAARECLTRLPGEGDA